MINWTEEKKLEMESDVHDYLLGVNMLDEPCDQLNCINCILFEDCHMEAIKRRNAEYAEAINYGGYNSADDFWEQI